MSEQHDYRGDPRDERDELLSTADLARGRGHAPETDVDPEPEPAPAREARSFGGGAGDAEAAAPVFPAQEADGLRQQWDSIQGSFVDEPRRAVEDADHLVAATMQRLAESFADERAKLEAQWGRGDDVSTEELRVALRRYRSFFGRLLSA